MKINKKHKDYPEFSRRWDELVEEYKRKKQKVEDEHPDHRGFDNPYTGSVVKYYHSALTALQKEYAYLYDEN